MAVLAVTWMFFTSEISAHVCSHENHEQNVVSGKASKQKKITPGDEIQSVEDLEELLKTHEDVVIADVRGSKQFAKGHIPGALNLPLHVARRRIKNKIKDKKSLVVVYGQQDKSPIRSQVMGHLRRQGYRNIIAFSPGMKGWMKAGKTIETGKNKKVKS